MKILAIETSCDETAVSIIEAEGAFDATFTYTVLGNALMSQMALHTQYGGVFPAMAKREHQKNLVPVLTTALTQAHMLHAARQVVSAETLEYVQLERDLVTLLKTFLETHAKPSIDAIAVTHGPGLEPALWVGINCAQALAHAWNIPLVPVNHMEGHIIISAATTRGLSPFAYPALALLISGGHTELVVMQKPFEYNVVGATRDDALGEAFDKVARLMQLPYPGGPEISRLAELARSHNIQSRYKLTRPMIHSKDLEFSFSGLKSSVRRLIESQPEWTDDQKLELAREFEDTVSETVVAKMIKAIHEYDIHTLIVGGGVSANKHIRSELQNVLTGELAYVQLLLPPPDRATDNALMIALAGYFRASQKNITPLADVRAQGHLQLK